MRDGRTDDDEQGKIATQPLDAGRLSFPKLVPKAGVFISLDPNGQESSEKILPWMVHLQTKYAPLPEIFQKIPFLRT